MLSAAYGYCRTRGNGRLASFRGFIGATDHKLIVRPISETRPTDAKTAIDGRKTMFSVACPTITDATRRFLFDFVHGLDLLLERYEMRSKRIYFYAEIYFYNIYLCGATDVLEYPGTCAAH